MKLKTKGKRGSIPQLFPKEFQSKSQNLMFEVMCSNISSIYQWFVNEIIAVRNPHVFGNTRVVFFMIVFLRCQMMLRITKSMASV